MKKIAISLLPLFLALNFNGSAWGDEIVKLSFGLYTTDKPTSVVSQFRPILNVLERSLQTKLNQPVQIKTQVATTYEQGINNIAQGRVDFTRLGPVPYIIAKQRNPQISILATEQINGKKIYHGIICVRRDSKILTTKDLKGKNFVFGNDLSTTSRILPQYFLSQQGLHRRDFGFIGTLERHDQVAYAVARGEYDAGALKEGTFDRLMEKGLPLRKLASYTVPTKPWVARHGLPARLHKALVSALLELADPDALEILGKSGFTIGNDNDYQDVRTAYGNYQRFND